MPSKRVLDASAMLAYMKAEPGGAVVREALGHGCAIGYFNVAEVLTKMADSDQGPPVVLRRLRLLGDQLELIQVELEDLIEIARLRPLTRSAGLSLADRACLALARRLAVPALTADSGWANLELPGIEVELIR